MENPSINSDVDHLGNYEDPVHALTGFFLEAVKSQKREFNGILFCQIEDLNQYHIAEDTFNDNLVEMGKSTNGAACGTRSPAKYVAFCGRIRNSKVKGNVQWFEIGNNNNDTITCRADLTKPDDLDNTKRIYNKAHKLYRDRVDEFRANPTVDRKRSMNQSCLLWQLERRSKQIFGRLNEVQLCEAEIKGRKVMVLGKLMMAQKERRNHVFIKQCLFVDDIEERRFFEMMNLAK